MTIAFNLLGCGLGNNGGSQTIIKSCEILNDLGAKSELVSDVDNFTWFKHRKCISSIPKDASAVIATGCGTVTNTSKLNMPKKYWWIRGHEDWWFNDNELLKLYNIKNIINITNSKSLANRIKSLGCNQTIHTIYQGIDLDLWGDLNLRSQNKKIKIGCLYGNKPTKRWKDFKKLANALGKNKYEFVGFGLDSIREDFLSQYIKNASKKQLLELYSSCDIWFAPTINEGLHNVPMEANLCGCLIVCSNNKNNGMILDYAFNNHSAFTYNNIDEAVSIIENKYSLDNSHIVKECQSIIRNNIGSRYYNMNNLIKLIYET
tara:strand:+ start:61 stop:1014 length:954 start_codon:yes stop_codon:yes gene_type:complete